MNKYLSEKEYNKFLDSRVYDADVAEGKKLNDKGQKYNDSAKIFGMQTLDVVREELARAQNSNDGCCFNFCIQLATKYNGLLGIVKDGDTSHIVIIHRVLSDAPELAEKAYTRLAVTDPARDLMRRQGVYFHVNPDKTGRFKSVTKGEITRDEIEEKYKNNLAHGSKSSFGMGINYYKNQGESADLRVLGEWKENQTFSQYVNSPLIDNKPVVEYSDDDKRKINNALSLMQEKPKLLAEKSVSLASLTEQFSNPNCLKIKKKADNNDSKDEKVEG